MKSLLFFALGLALASAVPTRHLRIVGLEFGQQEPMIRFTGDTEDDIAGGKAAMFETFTPIRLGIVAVDKDSAKGLTKGAVLYCKQRDDVRSAKNDAGEEVRIHQEVLDCHE